MNIEFGGGENPRKKEYTQVDVRKIREDDIVCNAWEVEKHIQPNTVDNIYSRHFFEHLTHTQAQRTLDAWYNICRPGAEITMLVPNMNLHLWQWNNWSISVLSNIFYCFFCPFITRFTKCRKSTNASI